MEENQSAAQRINPVQPSIHVPRPEEKPASVPPSPKVPTGKKTYLLLGFVCVVIIGVVASLGYFLGLRQGSNSSDVAIPSPTNIQQACTEEAKICPDGTAVGRVGPNCTFSACPVATSPVHPSYAPSISGWKTYTNTTFGFSFHYPNTMKLTDTLPDTFQENQSHQQNVSLVDRNIDISLSIDPAGAGPVFPDKTITLKYTDLNGIVITKEQPTESTDPGAELSKEDARYVITSEFNNLLHGKNMYVFIAFKNGVPDNKFIKQFLETFRIAPE